MALRRILRYFNLAVGALLIALLGAAYWYAWRPLPETDGTVEAPIQGKAAVRRDSIGTPHILAASLEDALFMQGYVTAQDRMFQMDALRRMAAGELAEIAGPSALASDRQARRMRLRRIAEMYHRQLPSAERALLAAYARGVNHYLLTHLGRLPLEFTLLRYEPLHWSIVDSLLILVQMMETLDRSWSGDLRRESLFQGGDPEKLRLLFPSVVSGEAKPGSNAWAVAGAHSATGRPLLAGDAHLEFSLPSAWHMVHLRGPNLNVAGFALPGLPGVVAGHNEHIAWSITSLAFDVQDLYVERFDPATGRYVFRGQLEQAVAEREVIRIRGQAPETVVNWVTRHGPVIFSEGGRFLSLRWAAAEPNGVRFPLIELNQARNWQEFRSALSRMPGPGLTYVYADTIGNVGEQSAGRFPIRRTFDGGVPLDGVSGSFEWDGFIPFEELPSRLNPPSGKVISANECPFPAGFGYRVDGGFAATYRRDQIAARLASRSSWRAEDMLAIQTDVYSAPAQFLAREIGTAYQRRAAGNADLAAAAEILGRWDGRMVAGHPAPMIATLAYQHVRTSLANIASPGKGLAYAPRIAPAAVEAILRRRPPGWVPDYDAFLLSNLRDALREGRRRQGDDPARWDYGRYNTLLLRNEVVGGLPLVGRYFNLGPVALSGSPDTVNQVSRLERVVGPSMRMVVDLGNLDASLMNITAGQSGQVLSSHYRDQWKVYLAGRSFPMGFNKVEAQETLTVLPERRKD